jgi:hypothetical protein
LKPGREDALNWFMEMTRAVRAGSSTSVELLVAGGVLLIFAALLLSAQRKTRMRLESSVVTEELMVYLARIANALEGTRAPSGEEISENVVRRLQGMAESKGNSGKTREVPFSVFGRDYLGKE